MCVSAMNRQSPKSVTAVQIIEREMKQKVLEKLNQLQLFESPNHGSKKSTAVAPVSFVAIQHDDDDSVSSISSDESSFDGRPRQIFGSYWDRKGINRSSQQLPPPSPSVTWSTATVASKIHCLDSDQSSDASEGANTYERVLNRNEVRLKGSRGANSRQRRRIWANIGMPSVSEPSLLKCLEAHQSPNLRRKIKSAPMVHNRKPGASCLREPQYSSNRTNAKIDTKPRRRKLSVTFNATVNVVQIEYKGEQYADDGWSNFFA